jgi:hypothetical protein
VLDALDKWDERYNAAYTRQRRHRRNSCRAIVSLLIPPDPLHDPDTLAPQQIEVWARNISQGGLSFIYPGRISVPSLVVGLNMPDGKTTWLHADIVRARQVPESFWEFGAAFRDRA